MGRFREKLFKGNGTLSKVELQCTKTFEKISKVSFNSWSIKKLFQKAKGMPKILFIPLIFSIESRCFILRKKVSAGLKVDISLQKVSTTDLSINFGCTKVNSIEMKVRPLINSRFRWSSHQSLQIHKWLWLHYLALPLLVIKFLRFKIEFTIGMRYSRLNESSNVISHKNKGTLFLPVYRLL